ncbi:hypothetical protein [Kitasatospora sp. CB02891]|uniref:hypothetical protein n=1 Tax=Kitasatospora sp. CB02891 TaxID=2020329 RepID=UPI000C27F6CE|nr:hypothetical protein [Kitasatospora sp. CB02891]PJN28199.1 hypothetical protein CG736_08545 [Kitasatospora sp. CB02891]
MITPLPAQQEPDRPRLCFVIGPIGDSYAVNGSPEREAYEHHLEVFEEMIAPACQKFGIDAVRADRIDAAGDINEQICRYILHSDLVVADISGGNPNVMYELGLRHLTGKPTIHIGEAGQLPFDIASIRTIQYTRARSQLAKARRGIEGALEAGIRDGFELLTPARMMRAIEPVRRDGADEDADEDGDDTPGLLDDFVAIEEGLDEMMEQLATITRAIETVGALTQQSNIEVLDLTQANAPASARHAAVARFADALRTPTEEMRTAAMDFAGRMARLDSGVKRALGFVEATPYEKRDEREAEFLEQLILLDESVRTELSHVTVFDAALGKMALMSRHLRKPVKDMSTSVKVMASAITCMGTWADQARSLTHRNTV